MDTRLEALAGFILEGLVEESLSDAAVYEFAEQSYICIREGAQFLWGNQLEKLWDYLAGGRTMSDHAGQDRNLAFQQGRVYAAIELLKMFQQQQEDESILEEDAKEYSGHWRMVFVALQNGRSMTHRELAKASAVSESSLSQFLHRIEGKNYIHFRKVGRTKYYRLSARGKKLLQHMPSRKAAGIDCKLYIGTGRVFVCADEHSPFLHSFGAQKEMNFIGNYSRPHIDNMKQNLEVYEDVYVGAY